MYKIISRESLKQRLDEGKPTTLVEALPAKYYLDKHLPGAINIPHDEIKSLATLRLPNPSAFIVVYCASTPCQNSGIAARILDDMGYEQVYEFVEGKEGWEEAGYTFDSGDQDTATAA